jgi:hypothetical protein
MVAHEYKHFSRGGTGLRSLLDVFVYLRRFNGVLDWDYIDGEISRLGITEFEKQNRDLACRLYGGGQIDRKDDAMLDYMTEAGTYGRFETKVMNDIRFAGGGKLRYAFSRIVLPMEVVAHSFPFFYKHKLLLPLLPFYRLFKAATKEQTTIGRELRVLRRSAREKKQ